MSSPPSTGPSFFQYIMGIRHQDAKGNARFTNAVKQLVTCQRCDELVQEDDMYKRKRKGKIKQGSFCRTCGEKGYRPYNKKV